MEQPETSPGLQSFELIAATSYSGVRLDHYLVQNLCGLSRSQIIDAIKSGAISVNGDSVKAGYLLRPGDVISGSNIGRLPEAPPHAQPVEFTVLHEDPAILIIAKPPGLVVHPGSGNREYTLVNGLLHRYCELAGVGDEQRPGIVHRLDKDTSGIMVIGRSRKSHRILSEDFKQRRVSKTYLALIHGRPSAQSGDIIEPIGRHPVKRQKMAVRRAGGRYAVSRWRIREAYKHFSLAEIDIETGRTHQIRVHMAHIGHPLAGDALYGPNRINRAFPRQMLHSWRLQFNHPESGEEISAEAPLPDDFAHALKTLEKSTC